MEKFNKIDLAEAQLETALDIYLKDGNIVSVLTLAGAAEEILGVCLKIKGVRNSIDELVDATCEIHKRLFGDTPKRETIYNRANNAKNNFKHLNGEDNIEISLDLNEEAKDMLNRAIEVG